MEEDRCVEKAARALDLAAARGAERTQQGLRSLAYELIAQAERLVGCESHNSLTEAMAGFELDMNDANTAFMTDRVHAEAEGTDPERLYEDPEQAIARQPRDLEAVGQALVLLNRERPAQGAEEAEPLTEDLISLIVCVLHALHLVIGVQPWEPLPELAMNRSIRELTDELLR